MFDDLRDLSEDMENPDEAQPLPYRIRSAGPERLIFGMTAMQRFIISILLFFTVLVMGTMYMLVTESLWLF